MKYHVNLPRDTGPRQLGTSIFPHITSAAGVWQGRGRIVGQPGTARVSARYPSGIPQSYEGGIRSGGRVSSDAPQYWYPSIYYTPDHWIPPAPYRSDNRMPVPALVPPNVILANPHKARIGGQTQIGQPQIVQTWPKWGKK
jgi:hypothetical protein